MSTLSWNSVSEINGDHGIELRDIKHKEEEEKRRRRRRVCEGDVPFTPKLIVAGFHGVES